jgi:hypothetical protein
MSQIVVQWNDRKNRHEIFVDGTRQYFVTFNKQTNPARCKVMDVRYAKLLEVPAEAPPIGIKAIVAMIKDGSLKGLQDERQQRRIEASEIARRVKAAISPRLKAIAEGLIRTGRAGKRREYDRGMLRLECLTGGFYWISLDGSRVVRGARLPTADELQPKFIEAMERAGTLQ